MKKSKGISITSFSFFMGILYTFFLFVIVNMLSPYIFIPLNIIIYLALYSYLNKIEKDAWSLIIKSNKDRQKVKIIVRGGVAEVESQTYNCDVEIIDYDNLEG
jgi:heme O synthase-like polyprenyltransferase